MLAEVLDADGWTVIVWVDFRGDAPVAGPGAGDEVDHAGEPVLVFGFDTAGWHFSKLGSRAYRIKRQLGDISDAKEQYTYMTCCNGRTKPRIRGGRGGGGLVKK